MKVYATVVFIFSLSLQHLLIATADDVCDELPRYAASCKFLFLMIEVGSLDVSWVY